MHMLRLQRGEFRDLRNRVAGHRRVVWKGLADVQLLRSVIRLDRGCRSLLKAR